MSLLPAYIPASFTTDRLLLRVPQEEDAQALYDSIMASLEDLQPWLAFANTEQSVSQVKENLKEARNRYLLKEDLRFLVFLKTGELIASCGLHKIDWDIPKFEIGYWLDSRYVGKGYMTETVEGLVTFATETLLARRIEIRCDAKNTRSRKVAERTAFSLEGILRQDTYDEHSSSLRDTCVYAKTF